MCCIGWAGVARNPNAERGSATNRPLPPGEETLYDQPYVDNSKARVTGPFTLEAVPAQAVKPLDEIEEKPVSDESIVRSGQTLRQSEWRDELLKAGIRGKGKQFIEFSRVEPMGGLSVGELTNLIGLVIQNRMSINSILTAQIGTHPLLTAPPTAYPLIKAAEVVAKKL